MLAPSAPWRRSYLWQTVRRGALRVRARLRGGTPQLIVGAEARSAPEPSVSKRSNASRISCFCSSVSACLALAAGRFAGGMRTGKAATNCSTCVRGRNSYHWMRSTPRSSYRRLRSPTRVPCRPRSACLRAQAGSQVPPLAKGDTPSPSVRPDPSDAAPTAPASLCLSESLRQAQSL